MALTTVGTLAKLNWPGINAIWGEAYSSHPAEWSKLFTVETSDRNYEEDQQLYRYGLAVVKPEGEPISVDYEGQGYTRRYVPYVVALSYTMTREAATDNLYLNVATKRTKSLARSMNVTKEYFCAAVLNNGFSNTYAGGDGKALLATDHPSPNGTWSNELSTAADLSQASLEDIVIQMANAVDDRGLPFSLREQGLTVPTALMFDAQRLLQTTGEPETALNNINTLKGLFPKGLMVNHYLSSTEAWFVTTDCPEGLKMFQRWAIEFGEDNDFDTQNQKYAAVERYSVGWTDPHGIYGSPGAGN
uniref:Putative capsid protein n=1 Tax=viral metagenome TaxID=1070528 RepID=A0A6M3LAL4_9ZZZZ